MSSPVIPTASGGIEAPVPLRLVTLGCRVNRCDSAAMRATLAANGYLPLEEGPFRVALLNSCTVTGSADREARRLLRRLRRENPEALIAITGCLARVSERAIFPPLEADLVLPSREPLDILSALDTALGRASSARLPAVALPNAARQSRFFLKVQDGCRVRCTFCIIPDARGPSRSVLPEEVLAAVRASLAAGFQETILTGINLGTYGWDLSPRTSLAALVRCILKETPLPRLRLGSLEPWSIRQDLLQAVAEEPRLLPSMHIPLQSGSPRVLRAMRRPGTLASYRQLLKTLLELRPGLTLWIDVIAGFPGETSCQHRESLETIRSLPFTKLHVFPYSSRPGTPATLLSEQIPELVRHERAAELLALSRDRFAEVLASRVDTPDEVLLEADGEGRVERGHTRDNLPVRVIAPTGWLHPRRGRIIAVRIARAEGEYLEAIPLDTSEPLPPGASSLAGNDRRS